LKIVYAGFRVKYMFRMADNKDQRQCLYAPFCHRFHQNLVLDEFYHENIQNRAEKPGCIFISRGDSKKALSNREIPQAGGLRDENNRV